MAMPNHGPARDGVGDAAVGLLRVVVGRTVEVAVKPGEPGRAIGWEVPRRGQLTALQGVVRIPVDAVQHDHDIAEVPRRDQTAAFARASEALAVSDRVRQAVGERLRPQHARERIEAIAAVVRLLRRADARADAVIAPVIAAVGGRASMRHPTDTGRRRDFVTKAVWFCGKGKAARSSLGNVSTSKLIEANNGCWSR